MYNMHTIQDIYTINIFEFDSKITLTSLFKIIIKTQFIYIIQLFFVTFTIVVIMIICFILYTSIFILSLLQDYPINFLLYNIIYHFLLSKLFIGCRVMLTPLKMYAFSGFDIKAIHYLAFIWWMTRWIN